MDHTFENGEIAYIVPKIFIDNLFSLEVDDLTSLKDQVGSIDFAGILNRDGNMYQADEESVEVTPISAKAFKTLKSEFGCKNSPVTRVMCELDDGLIQIERFPPVFIIHTLPKASHQTRYGGFNDRLGSTHNIQSVTVSQLCTFQDLVEAIRQTLYKDGRTKIRAWFITAEDVENIPASLTVALFVNSTYTKKLVKPDMFNDTLQMHELGASRVHVVAEPTDVTSKTFVIDAYLSSLNPSAYDSSKILESGGHLGLSNLGNTCYMNSALQCLVHIPELNYYFHLNLFKNDLNTLNPLGCNGEIAATFSGLLHKLFDVTSSNMNSITPRDFKSTIGRYSSMFHGYQQQDSQEFTSWLLDTLHEDLNRIQNKPYLEKPELKDDETESLEALARVANVCWDQHKMRNDSVIVDLFTGLYQSTLVCPTCNKKSVTFDPFNDLTLPLPLSTKWYHTITIIDLREGEDIIPLNKLEVELLKSSNLNDLIDYLSAFLKVEKSILFLYEIFKELFYKDFQAKATEYKFLPVSELISAEDIICAYIIPHNPSVDVILPVLNVVPDADSTYHYYSPFAFPLFVVLSPAETMNLEIIQGKVESLAKVLMKDKPSKSLEASEMSDKSDESEISRDTEDLERSDNIDEVKDSCEIELTQQCEDSRGIELTQQREESRSSSETQGFDLEQFVSPQQEDSERLSTPALKTEPQENPCFSLHVYNDEPKARMGFKYRNQKRKHTQEDSSPFIHIPSDRIPFGNLPLLEKKASNDHKSSTRRQSIFDQDEKDLMIVSDNEDTDFILVAKEQNLKDSAIESTETDMISEDTPEDATVNVSARLSSQGNYEDNLPERSEINSVPLVTRKLCLVAEWFREVYEENFEDPAWEDIPQLPNPELEANKRRQRIKEKASLSLYDCLRNFSSPEVLDEQDLWYCPRCQDHKRATKTIQLWSTGDILTVHLKRFQTSRSFSDKLNMVVDFPIEGLDMSEFVSSKPEDANLVYDLVAVDNHYGGLGGGHYTAYAKNFRDGKWYYFDDSRVSEVDDPKQAVSSAAYLLFYRKRSAKPFVGGEKVEALLMKGRIEFDEALEQSKDRVRQFLEETDSYNNQEAQILSSENELNLSDSGGNLNFKSLDDDDLYSDILADPKDHEPHKIASKNMRSPATAQILSFDNENQRKQRLISKDSNEPRAININLGLSSSASNLASPEVSSDDNIETLGG